MIGATLQDWKQGILASGFDFATAGRFLTVSHKDTRHIVPITLKQECSNGTIDAATHC
jgi:hypothetical protein